MAEDFRNQHIDFHNERYQTVRASPCKAVQCMTMFTYRWPDYADPT